MRVMRRNGSGGYTLVELMVAILIAFVVLGGVYQTIMRDTIDMEREEAILDMQNNARIAIDRITREVRRAGFFGCGGTIADHDSSNEPEILLNNALDDPDATSYVSLVTSLTSALGNDITDTWTADQPLIYGLRANNDVAYLGLPVDGFTGGDPLGFYNGTAGSHPLYESGTDALTLVYFAGDYVQENPMTAGTDPVDLTEGGFKQGDIILITDCKDYSLFMKTNDDDEDTIEHTTDPISGINNTTAELEVNYGENVPARIYNLRTSTFFVKKDSHELCLNQTVNVIANNIDDLQFEFMEDLNEDGDTEDAGEGWNSSVTDPKQVRAVRMWVLAMSEVFNDYTNKETYNVAGVNYAPNDHRYRYLASAIVQIRNSDIKK